MIILPVVMATLLGSFYISIGIFTSALTRNQIVAAILCFVTIFVIFSMNFLPSLGADTDSKNLVSYISAAEHMDLFSRGYFDTRPVVFYLSGTAFFLFLTQRVLEGRRLKA
jgi:ABC-2 type transport system permease protein